MLTHSWESVKKGLKRPNFEISKNTKVYIHTHTRNIMTNQEERKFRINSIYGAVPKKEIEKKKFIAKMMISWGFAKRTVMEYITALFDAGMIQENVEGTIIWREK